MSARPVVVAMDRQSRGTVDAQRWGALACDVLVASGICTGEMNLLFVDDDEMRLLNSQHMSKDSPTDVLAFPLDGVDAHHRSSLIGDVVVCPAVAAADLDAGTVEEHSQHCADRVCPSASAERPMLDGRRALEDRIALLVVHGVLHVLGHDHVDAAEAAVMGALERRLLAEYHQRR